MVMACRLSGGAQYRYTAVIPCKIPAALKYSLRRRVADAIRNGEAVNLGGV